MYKRRHGDQEAFGELVSVNESRVRKSDMSHEAYGKHRRRNCNISGLYGISSTCKSILNRLDVTYYCIGQYYI